MKTWKMLNILVLTVNIIFCYLFSYYRLLLQFSVNLNSLYGSICLKQMQIKDKGNCFVFQELETCTGTITFKSTGLGMKKNISMGLGINRFGQSHACKHIIFPQNIIYRLNHIRFSKLNIPIIFIFPSHNDKIWANSIKLGRAKLGFLNMYLESSIPRFAVVLKLYYNFERMPLKQSNGFDKSYLDSASLAQIVEKWSADFKSDSIENSESSCSPNSAVLFQKL